MQVTTLEGLFGYPSFILILLTTLITIANILVGVSILPQAKRKKGYKIHRLFYYAVLICYGAFLWTIYLINEERWLNYVVMLYFLFVIPITRRINITLHAVLASVGLVLLMVVATFNVL